MKDKTELELLFVGGVELFGVGEELRRVLPPLLSLLGRAELVLDDEELVRIGSVRLVESSSARTLVHHSVRDLTVHDGAAEDAVVGTD